MINEKCRAYKDKFEVKNPYTDIQVNLILLLIFLKNYVVITDRICDLVQVFYPAISISLVIRLENYST